MTILTSRGCFQGEKRECTGRGLGARRDIPQILVATFPQFISAKHGKEDRPGGGRVTVMALGAPPGPGSRGGVFGQVDLPSPSCSFLISKSPPEGCALLAPGQCTWSVAPRGWWVASASTVAMATVAEPRPQKLFPPSHPQSTVPTLERRGGELGVMKRLDQVLARCSPSPIDTRGWNRVWKSDLGAPGCLFFWS